ncbi:MAG: hypothetical protein ABIS08_03975 [Pseudolysinimonas sp.]
MTRGWTPERYRRLLKWYPQSWRDRNQEAIIGMLVEQAVDEGRLGPTVAERRSLLLNGLSVRFLTRESTTRPAIVAFAVALLYSAFYLSLITWAPDIHYAGTLWPFTNATPIPVVLLVGAFAAAVAQRARLARPLAYAAAVGELIVWALGAGQGWLGPSLIAALFFSGLAVCAGGAPSVRQLPKLGGALVLVLVVAYFGPQIPSRIALLFVPGITDGVTLPIFLAYVVLPLVALVVGTATALYGAYLLVRSAIRADPGARSRSKTKV